MPYYKFKSGDLLYNRLKTFPQQNFVIFDGKVYNNGIKNTKGKFNNVNATKQGFLSLYELNVDRAIDQSDDPPGSGSIYPFVSKDSTRVAFRTISTSNFMSGNINDNTIEEVWNSEKNKEYEQCVKPSNCGLTCKNIRVNLGMQDIINSLDKENKDFYLIKTYKTHHKKLPVFQMYQCVSAQFLPILDVPLRGHPNS